MKYPVRGLVVLALGLAAAAPGMTETTEQEEAVVESCLLREIERATDDVTVGQLRSRCMTEDPAGGDSLILQRLRREDLAEDVRSLLTPHKRNYVLAASYVGSPNEDPFEDEPGQVAIDDELDNVEAKFQLSLKFSLAEGLLTRRDRVYFGFTALSFWQAYNRNVSAPFRETNYEPELFWATPLDWGPMGLDAGLVSLGISHQSNGRSGRQSRSWNRIYADLAFEKENLVVSIKPWWRIPESEKDDPLDAGGDDNPDIGKYLGHLEFTTIYRRHDHEWSVMLRGNPGSGKGAVQLDWTFPLWRGVRGYAQYFNGYGESLIDYNAHIERVGVGILLSDLL